MHSGLPHNSSYALHLPWGLCEHLVRESVRLASVTLHAGPVCREAGLRLWRAGVEVEPLVARTAFEAHRRPRVPVDAELRRVRDSHMREAYPMTLVPLLVKIKIHLCSHLC